MEKTIFLFQRNPNRDREDFAEHYINVHAMLGRTLTRSLRGYTVNIVKAEGGPDAVTEHWVTKASDLYTPDIAYASKEDFEKVLVDDRTMFSGYELYVVNEEVEVVGGEPLDSPLYEATPEVKAVWLYRDAADVPPPPPGARRVVDNRVMDQRTTTDGKGWTISAPDYQVIRMAWASDLDKLGPTVSDALVVEEYRQIPPQALAGAGA